MDLYLSFLRAILPVIRDCPWKIVSTAPVGRLHISRWYTMFAAYTDRSVGICDQMLNNTKFSISGTHKKTAMFVKLAAMSHQKTVNDGPMDSRWTTFLQRPPGYVCYHYKNRQSSMPTISQKRTPKLLQGPLLPFSRWIQSCQIPVNDKTVTMQRRM